MDWLSYLWDFVVHFSPEKVNGFVQSVGPGLSYTALFLIVFAETGLVVTPFLPGDSLLFAVGAVAAHPESPIRLPELLALLCTAAIVGDAINYSVGRRVGPRVFHFEGSRLWNKKHLAQAHEFYEKYGGLTIIVARFVPIVRTFAPFVAGIGRMNYGRFALYNVVGGTAWVVLFLTAGWWFGGREVVQRNFHVVVVAIIALSLVPPAIEVARHRRKRPADLEAGPDVPAPGRGPEQGGASA